MFNKIAHTEALENQTAPSFPWNCTRCSQSCIWRNRPEDINHARQPPTLSVWSLSLTSVWRSLFGNELLEAAFIIHGYRSTLCPLFLEIILNGAGRMKEEWRFVLLICRVVFPPVISLTSVLRSLKPALMDLHKKTRERLQVFNEGSEKVPFLMQSSSGE